MTIVSANGEPFVLGQFYDARMQRLVYQGMSAWSQETLAGVKTDALGETSLDVSCDKRHLFVNCAVWRVVVDE